MLLTAAILSTYGSKNPTALDNVYAAGELKVISLNGPSTYYEGPEGYTGFEYQLTAAFAEHLGVKLTLIDARNQRDVLQQLSQGSGDFASAGIATSTTNTAASSNAYMQSTPQLIYHASADKPLAIDELDEQVIVIGDQSHHQQLLSSLQQQHPKLQWQNTSDLDSLERLEKVHSGDIAYTVVDSHVFLMNQGLYSQARVAFDLSTPHNLAWAFPQHGDQTLKQRADQFLMEIDQSGELAQLQERYFGHLEPMHSQGTKMFSRRINSRLPKYKSLMKTAARQHKLDWHFLAAMSYQESFWNPTAKSPTGVRGLMMLTRNTAKEVGVENRLDPKQSISGGASYFAKLRQRLPEEITEPDRSWMALAAYNMGMGHMKDVRVLTKRLGGNPNLWHDVKNNLPLLQRKKYYSSLKHGYARGEEASTYVQRIRHYYTVLSWHSRIQERKLAVSQQHSFKPVAGSSHDDYLRYSIL